MSNVYSLEPPTQGKAVMHTTFGDVEIEFWPKEAPKAVRNFVQLCMEGYYDNTPFHRVIKDFMMQGGDPTGTGQGGESIFGEPFEDEIHSRLKFKRRGLVAMANSNKPRTNASQFFFTLGPCQWLDKKHTIFAKVAGSTIFNVLRAAAVETDDSDRPIGDPPRIINVDVPSPPFDDIVPRAPQDIPSLRKKLDEEARRKAAPLVEDRSRVSAKAALGRKGKKKNTTLLSFGEEEEEEEEGAAADRAAARRRKNGGGMVSSHDVLGGRDGMGRDVDEQVAQQVAAARAAAEAGTGSGDASRKRSRKGERGSGDARGALRAKIRAAASGQGASQGGDEDAREFATRLEASARERAAQAAPAEEGAEGGTAPPDESAHAGKRRRREERVQQYKELREELTKGKQAAPVARAPEEKEGKSVLTEAERRRQAFLARKRAHGRRQKSTMERMREFMGTLRTVADDDEAGNGAQRERAYHGELREGVDGKGAGDSGDDDDDGDLSWMKTRLKFKHHIDDVFRADDYVTVDSAKEGDGAGGRSSGRSSGRDSGRRQGGGRYDRSGRSGGARDRGSRDGGGRDRGGRDRGGRDRRR